MREHNEGQRRTPICPTTQALFACAALLVATPAFAEYPDERRRSTTVGNYYPANADYLSLLCDYIEPGDRFLALGSGDGRVVAYALETCGADAWGIEYNDELYEGSAAKGRIIHGDFFDHDWSAYDVIFYYVEGTFEERKLIERLNDVRDGKLTLLIYHWDAGDPRELMVPWMDYELIEQREHLMVFQ